MIKKEKLKEYAEKLMFDMNDEEYETLQKEFEVILKQMDIIDNIDKIKDVEAMNYPFVLYEKKLREDKINQELTVDEVLENASSTYQNQVKIPKVVE